MQAQGGRVFVNSNHPRGPHGRDFREQPGGGAWLALAGFVGLPLLVGAAEAALTAGGLRGWYLSLARPPGTPPNAVFGPVWGALYVLMGVAAWLVWRDGQAQPPGAERAALRLWGWQLLMNAAWAPLFFGLRSPATAAALMPPLLLLIGLTARAFWRRRPAAGALLLPYLAWSCYAAYLAAGFWWLNRGA